MSQRESSRGAMSGKLSPGAKFGKRVVQMEARSEQQLEGLAHFAVDSRSLLLGALGACSCCLIVDESAKCKQTGSEQSSEWRRRRIAGAIGPLACSVAALLHSNNNEDNNNSNLPPEAKGNRRTAGRASEPTSCPGTRTARQISNKFA